MRIRHLLISSVIASLALSFNISNIRKSKQTKPQYVFRNGLKKITPTKNISSLLDTLLSGYDQKLRPTFGGAATTIEIDLEVRSMGQISEMDMTYSMDCYFRQSWVDERLAFSDSNEAFTLSVAVLDRLWKPDTFIYNGKRSYVHLITTPNKFIRLYQTGRILYSTRLTIHATCPMNLEDFPMDTQRCPLKLGSFGYTTKDILYKWNSERDVVIAVDMKLSQFDLIAAPSGYENETRRHEEFSTLMASFYLQRHMGNFLIQVYGPCMLLVVLSWVSFWLNREATADRISLGVTTVLTMTFLGLEARTDLPKVSYTTALDIFVWLSFGFIFATIIEFAFVHYFTKIGSGEDFLVDSSSEEEDAEDDDYFDDVRSINSGSISSKGSMNNSIERYEVAGGIRRNCSIHHRKEDLGYFTRFITFICCSTQTNAVTSLPPPPPLDHGVVVDVHKTYCHIIQQRNTRSQHKKSYFKRFLSAICCWNPKHQRETKSKNSSRRKLENSQQMNSVSYIDELSRILFPLTFLLINLIYWLCYLTHSQRIAFNLQPPRYAPRTYN